ncbi:TPA: CopG family transcriptional regulator [Candidatus Micrarchaeota archaeon]|nr:CopG family transcriptional regulator [Candidatus Micrarchaeota archaeon]
METIPAKITKKLEDEMDSYIVEGWYANRSEMMRDALRRLMERLRLEKLENAMREDVQWGLRG